MEKQTTNVADHLKVRIQSCWSLEENCPLADRIRPPSLLDASRAWFSTVLTKAGIFVRHICIEWTKADLFISQQLNQRETVFLKHDSFRSAAQVRLKWPKYLVAITVNSDIKNLLMKCGKNLKAGITLKVRQRPETNSPPIPLPFNYLHSETKIRSPPFCRNGHPRRLLGVKGSSESVATSENNTPHIHNEHWNYKDTYQYEEKKYKKNQWSFASVAKMLHKKQV